MARSIRHYFHRYVAFGFPNDLIPENIISIIIFIYHTRTEHKMQKLNSVK